MTNERPHLVVPEVGLPAAARVEAEGVVLGVRADGLGARHDHLGDQLRVERPLLPAHLRHHQRLDHGQHHNL